MLTSNNADNNSGGAPQQAGAALNVFVSRDLVGSTCRLLHNVIVDHHHDALLHIYAERVQDALLLACLLPFAEALETTWLDEGDDGLADYLDMLGDVVGVVRALAWTDKKFCHDVSESEQVCRTLLAAANAQVDMMGEIRNPTLIINIFHVFYLCLQNNPAGFAKLFVHLLRPIWADFADTIFAILRYAERHSTTRIDSMDHLLMELIFTLLHGQYAASFQDLLELPYVKADVAAEDEMMSASTVLDVLGTTLLNEQRQSMQSGETSRLLMQLMRVSAKARQLVVAAGEIEATIGVIRSVHADLRLNYRGALRVLSTTSALSSMDVAAMVQWMKLLLQMLYDNVEAKRIAARSGLTLLFMRLWPTLMQQGGGGGEINKDANNANNSMAALRAVVLQILMTFTAGCNDAGEAMVQPFYDKTNNFLVILFARPCIDDKPSPCLLQFILRDLLQQLSRTVRPNLPLIAVLFGVVCQCSFYSRCRVLIRAHPALLRTITLARPVTATTTTPGDSRTVNKLKNAALLNYRDLAFETTVRNLTFDLLVCLSYSEDGQFFICASIVPNAITTLFEIARAPNEFGVKAHGSALLVLRNFCFNRALLARIAAIQGLMPFLIKLLLEQPPAESGVVDARARLLATSILIELCARRRKLHKEFGNLEVDLDNLIRYAANNNEQQVLVLLHKLKKILDSQPRERRRRIRRGPIVKPPVPTTTSSNDDDDDVVEYYAAEVSPAMTADY